MLTESSSRNSRRHTMRRRRLSSICARIWPWSGYSLRGPTASLRDTSGRRSASSCRLRQRTFGETKFPWEGKENRSNWWEHIFIWLLMLVHTRRGLISSLMVAIVPHRPDVGCCSVVRKIAKSIDGTAYYLNMLRTFQAALEARLLLAILL